MSYTYSGSTSSLFPAPGLTGTYLLNVGGSPYISPSIIAGPFPTIIIRGYATDIGATITVFYSTDGGITITQSVNLMTSKIIAITSPIVAKYVSIQLDPPTTGGTVTLYTEAFFSSSPTNSANTATLNETLTSAEDYAVTRGIIAAQGTDGVPKNITSWRQGELSVGRYDGSLRQQLSPPENLLTMSRDIGFGLLYRPSTVTTSYANGASTITCTTDPAVAVSANSAAYGSLDDTFVLRFNLKLTSGTVRAVFGDSEFGVGITAGNFGVTWNYGTLPLVYFMQVNFATGVGVPTLTLDGDAFNLSSSTPELVPRNFAIANENAGSPMMLSARNLLFYARRLTPIKTAGTLSLTNPAFFTAPIASTRGPGSGVSWLTSNNFNIDKMDGTGTLPAFSGSNFVSGELIFTSTGDFLLMIANSVGALVPVHRGKAASPLFSGNSARLTLYTEASSSVSVADLSLYGYRMITGQKKSLELPTNWYTWTVHPANVAGANVFATGFWYLANIFVLSQVPVIHSIRVHTDYEGTIFLLTNTCAYTGGTEVLSDGVVMNVYDNAPYTGAYGTYPDLYTSLTSIRGLQSSGTSTIYDAVIASAPVIDGVATFNNVSFDYGSGGTIAIDSHFRGNINARIAVDYYI